MIMGSPGRIGGTTACPGDRFGTLGLGANLGMTALRAGSAREAGGE